MKITIDRAVVEQALEALEAMNPYPASKGETRNAAITALRAALARQPSPPPEARSRDEQIAYAAGWWAAMEAKAKNESPT